MNNLIISVEHFQIIQSLLNDDNAQRMSKKVDEISFLNIWNRLCFDIKAGHDDVIELVLLFLFLFDK